MRIRLDRCAHAVYRRVYRVESISSGRENEQKNLIVRYAGKKIRNATTMRAPSQMTAEALGRGAQWGRML